MSMNGLPYEEYKGWFLGQGLTMPTQEIFDINVYSSKEKLFEENPDFKATSIDEALEWIDLQAVIGG